MEQGTRGAESHVPGSPLPVSSLAGILNVDKPAGWTSFDVVAFVRRGSGVRRVGHAGTLDPAATGVLPILLGPATRLAQYLVDTTKVYDATIELGRETDTYDADGAVVHRADASHVGREAVEAALSSFRGEIEQVPPRFSAIKRLGLPLYKRARRGETVEAPPRRVRVDRLDIISYDAPVLRVEIECGKGFYVRSLAHDVGASLGVGGCLTALRRARVGPFRVEDAVSFDTLGRELASGAWLDRLLPPDEVLLGWRAAILGEASAQRLAHGRSLLLQQLPGVVVSAGERCRAYSAGGDFLAVLRCAAPQEWRPEKVFLAQSA